MLLTGVVEVDGAHFYFNRVERTDSVSWYLYNPTTVINGEDYRISDDALSKFQMKALEPFLVSAHEIDIEDSKCYGNLFQINQISEAMTFCMNYKYDNPTIYGSGKLISQGDLIKPDNEFLKNNGDIDFSGVSNEAQVKYKRIFTKNGKGILTDLEFKTSTVELKTISYKGRIHKADTTTINWDKFEYNKNIEEYRNINLAMKAKSLSQLRLIRDFSWYYDENNRVKKDYVVVDTIEKLTYYCKEVFPNVKYWGVDIESTGLDFYLNKDRSLMDRIVSIMFAWKEDHAIFIPIDMAFMRNIPKEAIEMLKPFLESIPAGGHNIGFDARALLVDWGISLNIHDDTSILNFNFNTYAAKFNNSLHHLEKRYLDVDTLELGEIFGTKKLAGLFRYLPADLAVIYACPDVELWLRVYKEIYSKMDVSCRKAYRLDMETLKHVHLADCNGNRVDMEKAKRLRECNNQDREIVKELIFKYVGQSMALTNYIDQLSSEAEDNGLTAAEYEKLLTSFILSTSYKEAKYLFNISSNKELANMLYNVLKYPIMVRSAKTNEPAVNVEALKALMREELTASSEYLKEDILSTMYQVTEVREVLVDAKEFNQLKYPLALLIVEYRLRDKRDSTFFKALIDKSIGGMYYSQSRLDRAETFRIINNVQVLQGAMKKLILPISEEHYGLVFDFSQIEYRNMGGVAGDTNLIEKLNHFRADFHIECCAMLNDIETWLVTGPMRSDGKALNFAIPYGMGLLSVCKSLYKIVNDTNKILANRQLNNWYKVFHRIKDFLDATRKRALDRGYVENDLGRRRYFYDTQTTTLKEWKDSLTRSIKGAINRASGNYPIQSGAADIFKIAFCNFRRRLKEEGLDKLVLTSALIHDELVNSVHKSVNKYYLYKIIYEECMIILKGHPQYFAGISIVDNWYEGKEDLYEAPMEFVKYIIDSGLADEKFVYQEDAKTDTLNDIREYMTGVYIKEFKEYGVDLTTNKIDTRTLLANLKDYFLRGKLSIYYKPLTKPMSPKKYENDKFIRSLERFVIELGKHDTFEFIYPEDYPLGEEAIVTKEGRIFKGTEVMVDKSITKTSNFSQLDDILLDDIDLDELSLDLFDDGDVDNKEDRLAMLEMLEEDDEELSGPVYFYYPKGMNNSQNQLTESEVIANNIDEHIKIYDSDMDKIRVDSHRIVLDLTDVEYEYRKEIIHYCNNFAVPKDTKGSVQVVMKVGINYRDTNTFMRGYSIVELKKMIEEGANVTSK